MYHSKSSHLFSPKTPPWVMFRSEVEVTQGSRPPADSRSQPEWPVYISSVYMLLFRYAVRRRGSGYSGLPIHQGRQWREKERETVWKQRPQDDKYQQEPSMNHNSSRDPKSTILNTQWGREKKKKRIMTKSARKWESDVVKKGHGYQQRACRTWDLLAQISAVSPLAQPTTGPAS